MPTPYSFQRIPVRLIDVGLHGAVIRAYEHRTGLRLLHRVRRRWDKAGYQPCGVWLLADVDGIVAIKHYFSRKQRVGPLQWADRKAREHADAR
jgi:hypothetical protein